MSNTKTLAAQPNSATLATPSPAPAGIYHIQRADNLQQVQRFIRQRFAEQHHAHIQVFAPDLLVLVDQQKQLLATLGYRMAKDALFLEQYLDEAIEVLIAQHSGLRPVRNRILEISNLASVASNGTLRLIPPLCDHFLKLDFDWLVMTLTTPVVAAFRRIHLADLLIAMSPASAARLRFGQEHWGQYYTLNPQVYAINLHQAHQQLLNNPLFARIIQRVGPVRPDQDLQLTAGGPL